MLLRTLRSWDVYMSSLVCWSKLHFSLLRLAFLNLCHWVFELSAQHLKNVLFWKGMELCTHRNRNFRIRKKDVQSLIYLLPVSLGGVGVDGKWAWKKGFSFNKPDTSAFIFSSIFSMVQFKKVSMTQIFSQHNPKEDPWYKYRTIKILWEKNYHLCQDSDKVTGIFAWWICLTPWQ